MGKDLIMRPLISDILGLAENAGGIFLSELNESPTMGAYALILGNNKSMKINPGTQGASVTLDPKLTCDGFMTELNPASCKIFLPRSGLTLCV